MLGYILEQIVIFRDNSLNLGGSYDSILLYESTLTRKRHWALYVQAYRLVYTSYCCQACIWQGFVQLIVTRETYGMQRKLLEDTIMFQGLHSACCIWVSLPCLSYPDSIGSTRSLEVHGNYSSFVPPPPHRFPQYLGPVRVR